MLIQKPNRREEVVGEIEPQRGVDFVDEDHQSLGPFGERDLAKVAGEPVARSASLRCASHQSDTAVRRSS